MKIFENFQTKYLKIPEADENNLEAWRLQALDIVLASVSIFGLLALWINIQPLIQTGQNTLLTLYIFAYLWIVFITLNKRVTTSIRYSSLVLFPYAAGLINLFQHGLYTDSVIWMFTSAVLASIFLGLRWGIGITVLELVTMIVLGILIVNQNPIITEFITRININDRLAWSLITFDLIFLSGIIITGLGTLINGLDRSFRSVHALSEQLDIERGQLSQQTQNLEHRITQIRTAAAISRTISGVLDPTQVLQQVVERVKEQLNLYYVGVFLIDENNQFALLHAGSGIEGKKMLAEGHKLPLNQKSMVSWAIANKMPRIALDIGEDAVHFNNPHLPLTRSELAIPLQTSSQMIGSLSIQSSESGAFDEDDIIVYTGIADSLAITLENARLFTQISQQASRELFINQISQNIQRSLDVESILSAAISDLTKSLDVSEAVVHIGNPEELAQEASAPGSDPDAEAVQ